MIITLTKADFSNNNIGKLNSWFISAPTVVGGVVTADVNNPSSIDKESKPAVTLKYTFDTSKYEYVNCTPSVGTASCSGNTITVSIPSGATIIANVTISIVLNRISGGVEEPEEPETPVSGGINAFNLNDTDVLWDKSTTASSTDGAFKTESGMGVSGYIAVKTGDIIRGGTYRTTTNTDGTNYYPFKSAAIYWYDANKTFLGATSNPTFKATYYTNDFICTVPSTPANIAYFRVLLNKTYKDTEIITVNSLIPATFIPYGDTTIPSTYISQGTAVSGGTSGGSTGTNTLEGVISAPSSTINVFNSADANTTKTLDTTATNGESYKVQNERGTSGFIEVKSGDKLRQATFREGSTSTDTDTSCYPAKASPTYFYDKDLKYISRIESYVQDGTNKDWIATVPSNSNIKYMRTMINTKYINSTIITINNTININTFVAYQKAN